MTPNEFKELTIETQKEFELFCNKRECNMNKCAIFNFLKENDCINTDCEIVFTICKLFNDFNIDLLKEIEEAFDDYCYGRDCKSYDCELKKYQDENTFLFNKEKYEDTEEEYKIDCALLYTIAYLNDCLDIIISD